jgi:hypothetical protein
MNRTLAIFVCLKGLFLRCDFWGFMFRVTKFIFTFNLPEFKFKIKTQQDFVCMISCVTLLRSIVLSANL